jgi:hypothetical protein
MYPNQTSNPFNIRSVIFYTNPITISTPTANNLNAGASVTLSSSLTVPTGSVTNYIWSWNNSGQWVNSSTTAFTSNPITFSGTWNATPSNVVSVIIYGNSTDNVWTASATTNFVLGSQFVSSTSLSNGFSLGCAYPENTSLGAAVAMSFVPTDNKIVSNVTAHVYKGNALTNGTDAYFAIFAGTGTSGTNAYPTGAPLVRTANIDVSTLGTTDVAVTYNFLNNYTLIAGRTYEIAFLNPSLASGTNIPTYTMIYQGTTSQTNVNSNLARWLNGAWETAVATTRTWSVQLFGWNYTDSAIPTVNNVGYTSRYVSTSCNLSSYWADESGLSGYIIGNNNTGTWVNSTWTAFGANPSWANKTITLNQTGYNVVQWEFWANDTANNWSNTGLQNIAVINNYQVAITRGGTNPFIVGDTFEGTIEVTKDGVAYSDYTVDITANGATFNQNGTSHKFTDVQYEPKTLIYSVTNLIDTGTNKVVAVYSITSLSVTWAPKPQGGQQGDTTSPTPTPIPTLGTNDFQVSNLVLGTVHPDSVVTVTLHFRFSGSSYTLQSISLPKPFNSWYVPNGNFSSLVYMLNVNGDSSGDVTLRFAVGNVTAQSYSGSFSVTALDAFGVTHTSSGTINADVSTSSRFDIKAFFMSNPLYLILVIAVVAVLLACLVLFSKRRR